ncbi:putative transposable element [Trichonephila clavipes]|nr:putative transposable element [Trichonephila clavipes]
MSHEPMTQKVISSRYSGSLQDPQAPKSTHVKLKKQTNKAMLIVFFDISETVMIDDEVHFWLNGYVNKQNCRIWSETNPQVYVETPLHPEKLTVWCALWAGGILLQK